jgi:hypothetical protein
MWRQLGQRRAAVGPIGVAGSAAHPPDIAVQLEDLAAAGAVVKAIHVLRDQGEAGFPPFELDQRAMGGIGGGLGDELTPPVVPFPNQPRVFGESFGRGEILRPVAFPKAAGVAKGGDATFGRNARAGKNRQRSGLGEPRASLLQFRHRAQFTARR